MLFRRKAAASSPPAETRETRRARPALGLLPWAAMAVMAALWPREGRGTRPRLDERAIQIEQPGRGRDARSPAQIPLRGWADILWRTMHEFSQDRIPTVAGGVVFFWLIAILPGTAAFVSLYGLFADIHDVRRHIIFLAGIAPRPAVVFLGEQMIRIAEKRPSSLSFAFVVSLFLSIWTANSGVKALFVGLNVAYEETEKRGFVRLNLSSLALTLGALTFLLLSVGALIAVPLLPFLHDAGPWISWLRWPALLALSMAGLTAIYRYGPSRERAKWRWVTVGGVIAALVWLAGSLVFSWYVSRFGHYDRTYGSFGAAAGAMLWLWMSVMIVLTGAELNAEIEHQTAVDSTTGPPRPMGKRGAQMADTIGKARDRRRR